MKAWKKMMAGVLAGVMSVGLLADVSVNAEIGADAVSPASSGICIGWQGEKEMERYVSFDYIKERAGKLAVNPNAKWDVYEKGVPSAWCGDLNVTKKHYITVDDGVTKTTFIFAAHKDRYSGKCDGTKITFKNGTKEVKYDRSSWDNVYFSYCVAGVENSGRLQCSAEGLDPIAMKDLSMRGATLYLTRQASGKVTENTSLNVEGIDRGDRTHKFFDVPENAVQGRLFKVKIPKMPNGPSISVDYKKNVIKEVKNAQMRAVSGDADIASATWTPAKTFDIDSSAKGIFEAKITKEGKADSKISVFRWGAVAAPDSKVTTTFGPNATLAPDLTVTNVNTASKTKSVILKNTSDTKTYLVYAGDDKSKGTGKEVATIKPGKEVKIVETKAAAGTVLWIGYAGDKRTNTLSSAVVKSGIIYFPTPDPAASK